MRIYIDTSVINGLYAEDPDICLSSENFFKFCQKTGSTLYSSDLLIEEIRRTPEEAKRIKLEQAAEYHNIELLPISEEVQTLAGYYVKAKIIPAKYLPDAFHIATAAVHNIPLLVSWNFEHIVKLKTKLEVNRIHRQHDYPQINICSPEEV